ncbi:TonB-dependent receptor [Teredinibacter sp. KSP-S5-2]|uniref:TonB-dependent receptor n=1 Tax=Teredinibacter sp. KSP-S5-2 TaxID=3034506 RepID=UPI002934232C|nr:TonB-dependent receptor [Teredinibacter sp. KSP-S5-2]WNO07623.1 TonB-dependent receptor [Teredinibacter sp. KSP-S5-2]
MEYRENRATNMIFSRKLVTLLTGIAVLGISPLSLANEETCSFDIPSKLLHQALKDFAEQCGYQILYKEDEIPKREVGPFIGNLLASEVFLKLIADTNLDYSLGKNHSIAIFQKKRKSDPPFVKVDSIEQPAGKLEETYVTGLRNSLQASIDKKRMGFSIQEHVSSEDIGRFPDRNIGDSLQRIPGISVDRLWGEGRDISVRGTSKDVNRTLLEDQYIASTYWWISDNLSRGFNYSLIPSRLIQSIEVNKSPLAQQEEGSLGGTINMKTYKPFEIGKNQVTAYLEYEHVELADKGLPQYSILGNWLNKEHEFGIFIALSFEERETRRDGMEAFFFSEDLYSVNDQYGNSYTDVKIPTSVIGSAFYIHKRKRLSGNIVTQWYPRDDILIEFNTLMSSIEADNKNQTLQTHMWAYLYPPEKKHVIYNPEFIKNNDQVILAGGELDNNLEIDSLQYDNIYNDVILRDAYTETNFYHLKLKHFSSDWLLTSQLGYSHSKGGNNHEYYLLQSGRALFNFDLRDQHLYTSVIDIDPTDPYSINNFSALRNQVHKNQDSAAHIQFDATYNNDLFLFNQISFGIKHRNHSLSKESQRGVYVGQGDVFEMQNISNSTSPRLHPSIPAKYTIARYAEVDKDLLLTEIRRQEQANQFEYQYNKNAYFDLTEDITNFYITASLQQNRVESEMGIRAAYTNQESKAYNVNDITTHNRSYLDLLPSISSKFNINNEWLFRTSLSKAIARPAYHLLSPHKEVNIEASTIHESNPNLDPYRANQAELAIEWYGENASSFNLNLFYKDISTFIYTQRSTRLVDNEYITYSQALNGPGLNLKGVELSLSKRFFYNYGYTANYTYTNAETISLPSGQTFELPGNSREQANLSFFYENKKISTRISCNYRSKSYLEPESDHQDQTNPYTQIDFRINYNQSEKISLYIDATNLTNEKVVTFTNSGLTRSIYEHGRRFLIGTKISF